MIDFNGNARPQARDRSVNMFGKSAKLNNFASASFLVARDATVGNDGLGRQNMGWRRANKRVPGIYVFADIKDDAANCISGPSRKIAPCGAGLRIASKDLLEVAQRRFKEVIASRA